MDEKKSFRGMKWEILAEKGVASLVEQLSKRRDSTIQKHTPCVKNLHRSQEFISYIKNAIDKKLKIGIFGDYDADGICSTVMWIDFLKSTGVSCCWYVPNRSDGYGPSEEGVRDLISAGADLLLFLDCGTNSQELDKLSLSVLILDHHRPQNPVKKCILVNTHLARDDTYKIFCTTGLSLIMISHICEAVGAGRAIISSIADLACIGTIGDVMPIVEFNRTMVKSGMHKINARLCRPGIVALCNQKEFTASDLAFYIVPCLNAAGRIGSAKIVIEALLAEDLEIAAKLATELHTLNYVRRTMEKELIQEAIEKVDSTKNIVVIGSETWHPGIVGIIAGRLRERYNKNVFVLYKNGSFWRGSARGIGIGKIIEDSIELGLLHSGGGHDVAGGVTVDPDKLNKWMDWLEKLPLPIVEKKLQIDAIAHPGQLVSGFGDIIKFAPFGPGNPIPHVLIENLQIRTVRLLKEDHLRLYFSQGGSAMAFRCGQTWGKNFKPGMVYDIVFVVDEYGKVLIEDARLALP